MSTRSGRSYKRKEIEERADLEKTTAAEEMADQMGEMMRRLLEDRQRCEQELREEWDEEMAKQTRKEHQRRDEEREEEIHQQMVFLRGFLEGVQKQSEATMLQVDRDDVKVAKLTSEDDIEAYLTTFQHLMTAHNLNMDR